MSMTVSLVTLSRNSARPPVKSDRPVLSLLSASAVQNILLEGYQAMKHLVEFGAGMNPEWQPVISID